MRKIVFKLINKLRLVCLSAALVIMYFFTASTFALAAQDISAETLLAMSANERLLLDVRTVEEYTLGHIPSAVNIPLSEISDSISRLSEFKGFPIVVYCRSGVRAAKAIKIFEESGFTNVMHLEGDMSAWKASKRPVNKLGQ